MSLDRLLDEGKVVLAAPDPAISEHLRARAGKAPQIAALLQADGDELLEPLLSALMYAARAALAASLLSVGVRSPEDADGSLQDYGYLLDAAHCAPNGLTVRADVLDGFAWLLARVAERDDVTVESTPVTGVDIVRALEVVANLCDAYDRVL